MEILKVNLIKGSVVNKASLGKFYIYKNIITQSSPPKKNLEKWLIYLLNDIC